VARARPRPAAPGRRANAARVDGDPRRRSQARRIRSTPRRRTRRGDRGARNCRTRRRAEPPHHRHVAAAVTRWPQAILHAAPGLADKLRDLKIDRGAAEIDPALDIELVGGAPSISECVLFHRPSGTLACADFVFNVTGRRIAARGSSSR
jgi:hypothetical protein